jgi:hypothetical protein
VETSETAIAKATKPTAEDLLCTPRKVFKEIEKMKPIGLHKETLVIWEGGREPGVLDMRKATLADIKSFVFYVMDKTHQETLEEVMKNQQTQKEIDGYIVEEDLDRYKNGKSDDEEIIVEIWKNKKELEDAVFSGTDVKKLKVHIKKYKVILIPIDGQRNKTI